MVRDVALRLSLEEAETEGVVSLEEEKVEDSDALADGSSGISELAFEPQPARQSRTGIRNKQGCFIMTSILDTRSIKGAVWQTLSSNVHYLLRRNNLKTILMWRPHVKDALRKGGYCAGFGLSVRGFRLNRCSDFGQSV